MKIEPGIWGNMATVMSHEFTPDVLSKLRSSNVTELQFVCAVGCEGDVLHPLAELRGIEWLRVEGTVTTCIDLSVLGELSALRYLDLDIIKTPKGTPKLERLQNLQQCVVGCWGKPLNSLLCSPSLERLKIDKYAGTDLKAFANLPRLECMTLVQGRLKRVSGLHRGASLRSLRLYRLRALESLDGLETADNLEDLQVKACRGFPDVEVLRGAVNLRRLHLVDAGGIASLSPIREKEELLEVLLTGDTRIEDCDLSPLLTLAKLRWTFFEEYPDYTHTKTDFQALGVEIGGGPSWFKNLYDTTFTYNRDWYYARLAEAKAALGEDLSNWDAVAGHPTRPSREALAGGSSVHTTGEHAEEKPGMSDQDFWALIGAARNKGGEDGASLEAALESTLARLEPQEVAAFDAAFSRHINRAYRWDVWGAAYLVNGGCGDDTFDDFRSSLILAGREAYEGVLKDPETLADVVDAEGREALFHEGYQYIAAQVYEEMTGEEMPEDDADEMPAEPEGEPWEEGTGELEDRFPKLAAKVSSS